MVALPAGVIFMAPNRFPARLVAWKLVKYGRMSFVPFLLVDVLAFENHLAIDQVTPNGSCGASTTKCACIQYRTDIP